MIGSSFWVVDGSRTLRGSDSERQGHGTAVCGETRTTNNEKTMIYCKDSVTPAGPLALRHARIHYSNIEMVMTDDWFVDADTLSRLRKFRREWLVISIVNVMNHLDLLDSLVLCMAWLQAKSQAKPNVMV